MATFKELGDKLEPRLKGMSNFKIGKTGQEIRDRYNQGYSDQYDFYEEIGYSKIAKTIDDFEEYLISRFINFKNCDNDQIGGGEMEYSEKYIVYLMYNK